MVFDNFWFHLRLDISMPASFSAIRLCLSLTLASAGKHRGALSLGVASGVTAPPLPPPEVVSGVTAPPLLEEFCVAFSVLVVTSPLRPCTDPTYPSEVVVGVDALSAEKGRLLSPLSE